MIALAGVLNPDGSLRLSISGLVETNWKWAVRKLDPVVSHAVGQLFDKLWVGAAPRELQRYIYLSRRRGRSRGLILKEYLDLQGPSSCVPGPCRPFRPGLKPWAFPSCFKRIMLDFFSPLIFPMGIDFFVIPVRTQIVTRPKIKPQPALARPRQWAAFPNKFQKPMCRFDIFDGCRRGAKLWAEGHPENYIRFDIGRWEAFFEKPSWFSIGLSWAVRAICKGQDWYCSPIYRTSILSMDADSYGKLTKEAYVYLLSTQRASGFPLCPSSGRQAICKIPSDEGQLSSPWRSEKKKREPIIFSVRLCEFLEPDWQNGKKSLSTIVPCFLAVLVQLIFQTANLPLPLG